MSGISFEDLRTELDEMRAPTGEVRHLRWLTPALSVARTASGDYEIFLRGPDLISTSPLVRRHLQHGEWRPEQGGIAFSATRVVLPPAPHFASVAALIAVELIRAGLDTEDNVQAAFSTVEPLIEIAIRRGALPENVIIGLIGELIVLRQCLLTTQGVSHHCGQILESWQGWQTGGRDFVFGANSVEVKTTQSLNSIHKFSGLHQLEEVMLPNGEQERLHLLSIGLAASNTMGESLASVVDQILGMIAQKAPDPVPLSSMILSRIEQYGTQNGTGYRHNDMKEWSVYSARYTNTYPPRLYRVEDSAMRLLRREDVAATFVDPNNLSFSLHIPDIVSSFNPAASWQSALREMISRRNK